MPTRTASAVWNGTLIEGNGTMRLDSGAYEGPYSFSSRFSEGTGSNPEELLAAAHSGCFSMFLANVLDSAGHPAESVETRADVHLTKGDTGFSITRIDLRSTVRAPGLKQDELARHAENAKANCPVSRALAVREVNVDARLG